jgi:acetyl-CoA acyltransferase
MAETDVYIVAAVRTAIGKAQGIFKHTRPDDLLSCVLSEMMKKLPAIPLENIDDIIIGCAMPEAEQGMNVARISALLAGFPASVPAMTLNRFCSSGLQTISLAADQIALGHADVMIAGGVESMSLVPLGGHHFSANPRYFEEDMHTSIAYSMGITAEKVASKWQITREEQDKFAFESHQKALMAVQTDQFVDEIIPFRVKNQFPDLETHQIWSNEIEVFQDQGPRIDTSVEALAKLRPVFALHGSVTAGNSSQTSDAACAVLLVSEKALKRYQLTPLALFKGFAVAGVSPEYMGIGPIAAIPKALKQADIKLEKIEWIELNEAFAAQSLAVINEMHFPMENVNPLGGAIALGHPLGATGAILATKLIHGARKKKLRYGLVTMCIGTGMGAAGIFEML